MELTRCRICGKPLRVPKSVERGIGPVCWGRLKRGEDEDFLRARARGEGYQPNRVRKEEAE